MCWYAIEFFKIKPTDNTGFPIGVVAQDGENIIYKAIPRQFWRFNPDDPQLSFYSLHEREAIVNRYFKSTSPTVYDEKQGRLVQVNKTSPLYLEFLKANSVHNFWYGPIHKVRGTANKIIDEIIAQLEEPRIQIDKSREFAESCSP